MTVPKNIVPNRIGAMLSVDEHGHLICLTYLCTWAWERLHVAQEVNTFDFLPSPLNCNDEFYLNNKVMPGYECE